MVQHVALIHGHFGGFPVLAPANSAAMNPGVCGSLLITAFLLSPPSLPPLLPSFFFFSFSSLCRALPWHVEVPRLGLELKLQVLTYAIDTAA